MTDLHIDHTTSWGGRTPRAWQAEALPVALEAYRSGTRGVIRAATGAGKSILIAELMHHVLPDLEVDERIVVTCPTQNLVQQLQATIASRLGAGRVGAYYQHAKDLDAPIIVTCHASAWDGLVACPECCPGIVSDGLGRHLEGAELAEARSVWQAAAMRLAGAEAALEEFAPGTNGHTVNARIIERLGKMRGRCERPWEHERAASVSLPGKLAYELAERELRVRLWFADECHKTQSPQCLGFAGAAEINTLLGCTATPWRSDPRERLELFDELLYDYGPSRAIRDRVVLMPTVVPYVDQIDEIEALDEACAKMIEAHLEAHPGPGIVSARHCDDADAYAAQLRERGIGAQAVHSKVDPTTRLERIAELERGELQVLVHVNMLAEGVDFPWLQWLCMRRQVGSVRFVQEAGRVLRVHPGKPGSWILDPLHQWQRMGLDAEALLGGEAEPENAELRRALEQLQEALAEIQEQGACGVTSISRGPGARALSVIEAHIYDLAVRVRLLGYGVPGRIGDDLWRDQRATATQLTRLRHAARQIGQRGIAETLEDDDRAALRACMQAAYSEALAQGAVSDLIVILDALLAEGGMPEIAGEVDA